MTNLELQKIKKTEGELISIVYDKLDVALGQSLILRNITDEILKQFDTKHYNYKTDHKIMRDEEMVAGEGDGIEYKSYMGFRLTGDNITLYYIRNIEDSEFYFEIPNDNKLCGRKCEYNDGIKCHYVEKTHLAEIEVLIKELMEELL